MVVETGGGWEGKLLLAELGVANQARESVALLCRPRVSTIIIAEHHCRISTLLRV
jgi:hypothetical protein